MWSAALAAQTLELRGRIEPAAARAVVNLWGATTPYSADTISDGKGRFRFRRLAPGSYTVHVFLPGRGEARRTVNVAGAVTEAVIPLEESAEGAVRAAERTAKVSVRELKIPGKARAAYVAAQKKLGRRDTSGAVAELERALELAPGYTDARNNLGTIAYQSGRYPEAERHFREALAHDPGAYAPTVNLGGVLLNLNRAEEARRYNEYAVRQQPSDPLAQAQLGMTHAALGNFEQAERHLLEAIRLDPAHFSNPQLVLARLYLERGDRAASAGQIEDFLRVHPEWPGAAALRRQAETLRQR